MAINLNIGGMTCNHCAKRVSEALEGVDGVLRVEVSLDAGTALVEGDAGPEALIAVVRQAGYEARLAD